MHMLFSYCSQLWWKAHLYWHLLVLRYLFCLYLIDFDITMMFAAMRPWYQRVEVYHCHRNHHYLNGRVHMYQYTRRDIL